MKLPAGIVSLAVLVSLVSGCGLGEERMIAYEAKRRATLLEMYPPGKTSRAQVRERFGREPELSGKRPKDGWESREDRRVRSYTVRAEKRIGGKIASFDRYYGADGLSSLCYCWFYFDSRDRVIDTEWQWSSD